ncbi:MAG TPA: inorganic phosphate transporter, partial [Pseudogracilibacillus sp.]|nr:inorganic phosphate transporter [Pseudogracilibacillus sp.]
FGIPIPMTQITTTGILGIGAAEHGRAIFQRNIIKKIFIIWLVSPVISLVISYTSVKVMIEHDMYSFFVILAVLTSTIGSFGLLNMNKNKNYVRQRKM